MWIHFKFYHIRNVAQRYLMFSLLLLNLFLLSPEMLPFSICWILKPTIMFFHCTFLYSIFYGDFPICIINQGALELGNHLPSSKRGNFRTNHTSSGLPRDASQCWDLEHGWEASNNLSYSYPANFSYFSLLLFRNKKSQNMADLLAAEF